MANSLPKTAHVIGWPEAFDPGCLAPPKQSMARS
jgi:hypothetical protein